MRAIWREPSRRSKPVADAYVLDTSHMSLAQAIQTVIAQYESCAKLAHQT